MLTFLAEFTNVKEFVHAGTPHQTTPIIQDVSRVHSIEEVTRRNMMGASWAGLDKMVITVITDHGKFELLTESFTWILRVFVYILTEREYLWQKQTYCY